MVDVRVGGAIIAKPRADVAAYATHPDNDPKWIGGISGVKWLTPPPLGVGTRVERVAHFLGKRIEYVLEVVEHRPGELLAMKSVKAPFPMAVAYRFADSDGGTRMEIHVEGGGGPRLMGPLMAFMVRRNLRRDLRRLKGILEAG